MASFWPSGPCCSHVPVASWAILLLSSSKASSTSCDLPLPSYGQESASHPWPPHTQIFVPLQVSFSTVPSKEPRTLLCLVCRNFQSPQSLAPICSTTVCKEACRSCSWMSETSEEPRLENGSSLGNKRTQSVEGVLRSYSSSPCRHLRNLKEPGCQSMRRKEGAQAQPT